MKKGAILLWLLMACLALHAQSVDKSGVKTNTISLPSGPGSIEGLGESFQPSLNTGQANYQVGLAFPPGTAGHAPSLALVYNGGNGNSPLGYGWNWNLPHIQRQSDKGIPLYVDSANGLDDDFDGETDEVDEVDVYINELREELVLTDEGYLFCENEGAFIRYERVEDHWRGTLPNGTLLEFGLTDQARIIDEETGNVFSWLLERETDTNGNAITYSYSAFDCPKDLHQKYLTEIKYGPGAPPWDAFHSIRIEYEDRFDWFEDCRPGFKVRTGLRVRNIYVSTQGVELDGHLAVDFNEDGTTDYLNRIYRLYYQQHEHWSLLSNVTWIGGDGQSPYPPIQFKYTDTTPKDTLNAADHIIGEENAPIQLIDNPLVDLIDLNADGLPDLLKTDQFGGVHSVFLNEGEQQRAEGNVIVWRPAETVGSEDGLAWQINLQDGQNAIAHLADMDADGLADLVYKAPFGEIYYFKNKGDNSWGPRQLMNTAQGQSAPPSPFGAAAVKTADIDFDKHIDIIQSISVGNGYYYRIWFNLGNQQYSQAITVPQEQGYDLANSKVRLSDFNGDRVPDLLLIRPTGIQVTAGLGHGEFADPMFVPMPDLLLSGDLIDRARLHDINGDGLSDLVIERAAPNQLWYWLNLGNYSFDKRRFITGLPDVLGLSPSIRWADMNGNGTTDLVYSDPAAAPRLQIIDLGRLIGAVPSPNLLIEIDNGIGQKTKLEYTTSTQYLLEDKLSGKDWQYPLPFPINVVRKAIVADGMGNDYETEFFYHDGYYDGEEKEFRGFAKVESREIGDASAPDLIMAYSFDTGALNEALKGKQLSVEARNAQGEMFFRESQKWETKILHQSNLQQDIVVTFPYPNENRKLILEKGNGSPVELLSTFKYDDFGNMTEQLDYGRLEEGWDDERKITTRFSGSFEDGQSQWVINKPVEQKTTDELDTLVAHSQSYYDRNLELGQISKGNLTRVENWVDSNKYIVSVRNDYDTYGNVIASYDPLFGVQAGHYRELRYDPFFHSFPEEEIIHTGKLSPATLNFKATYDLGYGTVLTSTNFNSHTTTYKYDAFARLIAITKPLDSQHTTEYDYMLGQAIEGGRILNWVESRQLDGSQGDGYLHSRTYVDGLGREIMTRAEGEREGQIVVTNTVQFNKRKRAHKSYLPYFETGSLDFVDPTFNTGYTEHFYDALTRPIRINQPAGPNGIVFSQIEYQPLVTFSQDEEQTDPDSKFFGCGSRNVMDGLTDSEGTPRLRSNYQLVKLSDEGEEVNEIVEWKTVYEYDLLDNMVHFIDAQNNHKFFKYDALSRKTYNNDPNRGISFYHYDDASNLVSTEDAKNQVINYGYDGLNRLIAEYYDHTDTVPDVQYCYDVPEGMLSRGELWGGDSSRITSYNTLGYLSWIMDQSGEEHYSYDERGRTAWTVKRITGEKFLRNFYTGYAYDAMDRVTVLTYPDASQIRYEYNSRGLLETIPNFIQHYDYNPAGQNALLALACGTTASYQYDHRLRLQEIKTIRQRDQLDLQYSRFQFDAVSNILTISDHRDGGTLDRIGTELELSSDRARKFNATQYFTYDHLYRLTQAANPDVYGTINYRYDRTGNLVQKEADLLTPNPQMSLGTLINGGEAGAWNRVGRSAQDMAGPNAVTSAQAGNMIFTYDANGNMTSDQHTRYTWDVKDRLTQIKKDSIDASYIYNYADTRKVKFANDSLKATYIDQFSEIRDTQFIKYVFAGRNRIGQIKLDTTFFLHDHLGSTSLSLDDSAKVVEQIAKHPYGLTRLTKNVGFETPYTFTGKEQDQESNNFYFEARYYSAITGKFISVDPLLHSFLEISPYAYSLNNPIAIVDSDGKQPNDPSFIGPPSPDPKGNNAAWSRGKYLGQIRTVKVKSNPKVMIAEKTQGPFQDMSEAASKEGISLKLNSGFRSYPQQLRLWRLYKKGKGNLAARPGYSNHQNGIAFDIAGTRRGKTGIVYKKNKKGKLVEDKGVGRGATYSWLKENATKYGFVRTVKSESWHWEYKPGLAKKLRAQGEYRSWMKNKKVTRYDFSDQPLVIEVKLGNDQ